MLRYRESLGLLPEVRDQQTRVRSARGAPPDPPAPHRRFDEHDLEAVALALAIERRYDISPAALAFGLRVVAEPGVRAEVAELGRRIGRIRAPAARALDFEQERAQRLLELSRERRLRDHEWKSGAHPRAVAESVLLWRRVFPPRL